MRLWTCFCSSALLASLWFGCGSDGDEAGRADGGSSGTASGGSGAQTAGSGGSSASGGNSASGGSSGSAGTASGGSSGTASGGSSGTASGGSAGSAAGSSGSGSEDASLPDVVFTYDAVAPEAEACATTTVQAELIPLDMYVMLDVSSSMLDATQSAGTKWDATKQAFIAFAQDPKSNGLGVGIQYFSLLAQGVPTQCTNQNQCGTSGPCVLKACSNNINAICTNNGNCGLFATCVDRGYCSNNANIHCIPVGGTACGAGNQCLQLTNSYCFLQDSCVAADYATPAVAIAPLPGNRNALVNSINAQAPWSATPTSAALQGAVNHARSWATSHPTHRVVVLLATDGLPTRCDQNIANIAQIAAAGANGSPKVSTYVLGVFSPAEATQAQQNLDQIAASGGSGTAFIVGTSGNVSQALVDALNKIRGAALSCEYLMPKSDAGVIDPNEVKLIFEDGSGTKQELGRVAGAGACGPNGGFYYDNATNPTKILLCPDTCTAAQNVSGAKVSIELGCLGA
jgi:hypothetical protein